MADNTTLNPGTLGDVVRDVDRSGIKTQVQILDISQSGDAELLGLGESRIVEQVSSALTTGATAYTAGDQLGGEMSFLLINRTGKGAVINSAILIDASSKVSVVDLFLFESASSPAGGDNGANAWTDANMLKLIGVIHFTDAITSANNTVLQATNLPIVVKAAVTTVFGVMVTRTANAGSFAAATDIQIRLGVIRD